jgi:osmotically-inducible protein OsmY
VTGALAAEPALRGGEISVDAYDGEVTLFGKVVPAEQARRAVAVAGSVFGVESVKADLQ